MTLSSGSMSVGVLAIFSGLLGAYGLRAILLAEPPAAPPRPVMVTIPLATTDLPEGRKITLGDIGLHRMTPTEQAKRNLANASVMMSPDQIIGRTLSASVKQGEPFLTTSLFLEGVGPNIAERLKPGYRAVVLEIPAQLGGMTPPGNFVDVLFRSAPRPANPSVYSQPIPETTITLFEAVEVLRVEGARTIGGSSGSLDVRYINGRMPTTTIPPNITLAVTLEQANILRTVEGRGEISLIPRAKDDTVASTSGMGQRLTLEGLLGVEPPMSFATEIYRRGSREVRVFDSRALERAYVPSDARPSAGATSNDVSDL